MKKGFIFACMLSASIIAQAQTTGTENGHEWIDLGLSVKWATCNVGATVPEGHGNYYAWAETSPKSEYKWDNYLYRAETNNYYSKYSCGGGFATKIDSLKVLELSDDAAHVNWGGAWRMPTQAEWNELYENCYLEAATLNEVAGYKVTSISNGNSVFFPFSGYYYYDKTYGTDSQAMYWSSSLNEACPKHAHYISFEGGDMVEGIYMRVNGLSVRGVLVQPTTPTDVEQPTLSDNKDQQKVTKILHKGEIFIFREGKTYNTMGIEVEMPIQH